MAARGGAAYRPFSPSPLLCPTAARGTHPPTGDRRDVPSHTSNRPLWSPCHCAAPGQTPSRPRSSQGLRRCTGQARARTGTMGPGAHGEAPTASGCETSSPSSVARDTWTRLTPDPVGQMDGVHEGPHHHHTAEPRRHRRSGEGCKLDRCNPTRQVPGAHRRRGNRRALSEGCTGRREHGDSPRRSSIPPLSAWRSHSSGGLRQVLTRVCGRTGPLPECETGPHGGMGRHQLRRRRPGLLPDGPTGTLWTSRGPDDDVRNLPQGGPPRGRRPSYQAR